MKTYFGMLMANPRLISGIVNNDIDNDVIDTPASRTFATETMMNNMLNKARAQAGRSAIFCHPDVKTYLQEYKSSRMQLVPANKDFDTMIDTWSGIPIITTYNVLEGNEPNVSV